MTDLPTRLRALATRYLEDEHPAPLLHEAAAALEHLRESEEMLGVELTSLEIKQNDLNAKLAEVQANKDGWQTKTEVIHKAKLALAERAEKAEAEAAALRNVILHVVGIDRLIGGDVPEEQVRETRHFDSDSAMVTDFIDVLSQQGPGAALLEDYKRTQRDYQELWDSRDDVIRERNELQERMKGLEWVRQAATAYLNLGGDYRQKILNHALASLEKKP